MRERGFTLLELIVVLTISVLTVSAAVPRYRSAMEHTRVDRCTGSLRSIWDAQRLYWLEHRTYADSVQRLVAAGVLDGAVARSSNPFSYEIVASAEDTYRAEATRAGPLWEGTLAIDQSGTVAGHVEDSEGKRVDAPVRA